MSCLSQHVNVESSDFRCVDDFDILAKALVKVGVVMETEGGQSQTNLGCAEVEGW